MFTEGNIVRNDYSDGGYILVKVLDIETDHITLFAGEVVYKSHDCKERQYDIGYLSASWFTDAFYVVVEDPNMDGFHQALIKLESKLCSIQETS